MANLRHALGKLYTLEYGNKREHFLHHNEGEDGYTLGGVYQKYDDSVDWNFIQGVVDLCDGDIKRASSMIYGDPHSFNKVAEVFKHNYWDKLRLDEIESQIIAEEMFIFGVVAGNRNAARIAQAIVGATTDGVIGSKTIAKLNSFSESDFSKKFDEIEKLHFKKLAENNPKLGKFLNGWNRRADYV